MESSYDLETLWLGSQWLYIPASVIKMLPALLFYRKAERGVELALTIGLVNYLGFLFCGGFLDPITGIPVREMNHPEWLLLILLLVDLPLIIAWRKRYTEKSREGEGVQDWILTECALILGVVLCFGPINALGEEKTIIHYAEIQMEPD